MPFESFLQHTGIVAPMPAQNIDTDTIMPKTFLKGIDREGLAEGVFYNLRHDKFGKINPDFILNKKQWLNSKFIAAGPNFGCGSSREHAVWGLQQFGIKAIFASSFAGIFFDNCARNGLLAIEISEANVKTLMHCANSGRQLTIDLKSQTIETPDTTIKFDISNKRKHMLLNGLDAIDMTLERKHEIDAFQAKYLTKFSWLT
ncbi:3-isopropylmalate dehydratase small subunit [Hirschia baltica]|uniref:3-isopropylmalate dehydratase small subunit n=1 Tax=Hirschia baltica (strain ATCC 49814 / DSM 5838 / IFAM 1418) TaxID=582402 RepID=C6XJC5_HIRBI|nr:3-isopropylmalate dehydratase small subunit [Hirschia baltica]ACT59220.1 3-isopropylmalate dehydratase, small subunit [Hirschia baltica ATCC 49814]